MMRLFTQGELYALLLSLVAGLSTVLGSVLVFFSKGKNEKLVTASLGFAGGVMISVSFIELLPVAERSLGAYLNPRLGVLLSVGALISGILLATGLDQLVPQEHEETDKREHKNLFRIGFVSSLAIAIHNFPEGIATFMSGYSDLSLGVSMTIAISMHNIPEGISVAMPIYFSSGSRKKALKYTLLSGIAEPVGALITFLLLRPYINDLFMGLIFGLISGIMLYIAVEELIPSSRQYGHKTIALISTFSGICLMPLANIF